MMEKQPKKILVIRSATRILDQTLVSLQEEFPGCHITVLLPQSLKESMKQDQKVNQVLTIPDQRRISISSYGKQNIRVNAICPVFTVTPLFNPDLIEKVAPGIPQKLKANVPMKRFAEVQEQVDAMLWLASDKASFVTGVAFPVDGGLTA